MRGALAAALLAPLLGACSPLALTKVESAETKPANVYVLFRATDGAQPAAGLAADAFKVTEDGFPVPDGKDMVLVNPDLRGTLWSALVLDLSDKPAEPELEAMAQLAQGFVERLGGGRRVAVYAIDGAAEPLALVPFGAPPEAQRAGAKRVTAFQPRDASTDLNGGYLAVWKQLRKRMEGGELRAGSVVLVARGPDRAARATDRAVKQEARATTGDVAQIAIALGPLAEKASLSAFADGAPIVAASAEALRGAQGSLLDRLEARARSYYLLSYCSKARAGKHRVRVDATRAVVDDKGHEELHRGNLEHEFSAEGFGAGCTPQVPPGWADAKPSDAR